VRYERVGKDGKRVNVEAEPAKVAQENGAGKN